MPILPKLPNVGLLAAVCFLLPWSLQAQRISDVKARYSATVITKATIKNAGTVPVDFSRHNLDFELGLGQGFVGFTYQYATKERFIRKFENTFGLAEPEDGLMLTAGYNFIFSERLRLDTYGRLGVGGNTNEAQALYATDTEVQMSLVMFTPDGVMHMKSRPVFPSLQAGINVNKFGRVQGLAGAGLWWRGLGIYLSAFQAFNGISDPLHPGEDADKVFAYLKNSGATLGVTYEFRDFLLWLKHNHAIMNGGNDLMLSLQYQRFFQRKRR